MKDIPDILGETLADGKTKTIYEHSEDPNLVVMYFKDDITAGDGAKHDVMEGKGVLHWEANKNMFELLNRNDIPTHYVSSPTERYSVVKKLEEKYELEVVARRIATGSYLKRYPEAIKGDLFDSLVVEFFYKDDVLNDPMVDERHLKVLKKKNKIYNESDKLVRDVFHTLEHAFEKQDHQLIDLKIEVGRVEDEVLVTDEITPDSFRLWPWTGKQKLIDIIGSGSNLNVIECLNEKGMKDKQLYREGKGLGKVKSGFETITEMTKEFT